ncbi:MAG: D-alanine--D-alanine ligase [Clostridia bacterium]|nr:D-alanine--D-alanine ligase [Clostridia bacterium]
MENKRRVAVIFGGQSSEHEVSRVSAQSIINNIDRNKFDVVMIGITKDGRWLHYYGPVEKLATGEWQSIAEAGMGKKELMPGCSALSQASGFVSPRYIFKAAGAEDDCKTIDVAIPVLHGINGEDGTIQGLLELAGIPYVGCGVLGSALGMDKAYAKIIFEKEGIPQGKYLVFSRKQVEQSADSLAAKVESMLTYPCFVKPSNAGSSVGVSKAHNREELVAALHFAARYDRRILVEEFMNGREVECAVLGNDEPMASTVGEVVPCNEFYDYEAKYNSKDSSKVIIPADLPSATVELVRNYAVKAFKALDCSGLSRVDFFVDKVTGAVYINEINTFPGFTQISMYPKLWEVSGIPYGKLIERLIELAIERFEESRREI